MEYIIVTYPKGKNFTANSIIHDFAKQTGRRSTYQMGVEVITIRGRDYAPDHWEIKANSDDTETVKLYLKEVAQ